MATQMGGFIPLNMHPLGIDLCSIDTNLPSDNYCSMPMGATKNVLMLVLMVTRVIASEWKSYWYQRKFC